MNKKDEIKMKKAFDEGFKAVFQQGLLQGSKAICHVILEKAKGVDQTDEERLCEIIKFCEVSLQNKNEKKD